MVIVCYDMQELSSQYGKVAYVDFSDGDKEVSVVLCVCVCDVSSHVCGIVCDVWAHAHASM